MVNRYGMKYPGFGIFRRGPCHVIIILILILGFLPRIYTQLDSLEEFYVNYEQLLDTDMDSALEFVTYILEKGESSKNSQLIGQGNYMVGAYYFLTYEDSLAEDHLREAINVSVRNGDTYTQIKAMNKLGNLLSFDGRAEESISLLQNALSLVETSNIQYNLGDIYKNLGDLFAVEDKDSLTLSYYKKAYEAYVRDLDTIGIVLSTNNLAGYFDSRNVDSAEYYYRISIEAASQIGDRLNVGIALGNLSMMYLEMEAENRYHLIPDYLKRSEEIWRELGRMDKATMIYRNYGAYYMQVEHDYDRALFNLKKAETSAPEHARVDIHLDILDRLVQVCRVKHDYEQALAYSDQYHELHNEVKTAERAKAFDEIRTQYEVEKKDNEINLLQKEKEVQRNRTRFIIVSSLLLLLLSVGGLVWFRQRVRAKSIILEQEQRIHEQERERLEQANELAKIKGEINGQEIEKSRMARELHDGIGGRLAAVRLGLNRANQRIDDAEVKKYVEQLEDTYSELRSTSHRLSGELVMKKELQLLIVELTEAYPHQFELIIHPDNWSLQSLDPAIKLHIYRIIQELVLNIDKHARAKHVVIQFLRDSDRLTVMVEDDGTGFETSERSGLGLSHIGERVDLLGGEWHVDSQANGRGTTVTIDIPLG